MTKLFKEENKDLPKGKTIVKYIFLLFISANVSAQTILNNFGISEIIKTYPGFTKFSFIDFNNDGIDDIILYGGQSKSFVLHKGLPDSSFAPPEKKSFFFPIDDFKWLTTSKKGENYYLFVSRNKRLAGLVSFNSNNSLRLLSKIEFNSYPSSIDIIDINNDSKNEAIVFGPNFNGFEILVAKGFTLTQQSALEENILREIIPLDFNQDGNSDLIGIDILNNSLKFLENYSNFNFTESREIPFTELLLSLKKVHYNNDDFTDLAITDVNGIKILMGDSVYSFSQNLKFNFDFVPTIYEIDDFNKNGFKDIAAVNSDENKAYVKLNDINYNIINYSFDGITDLKYLKNKYVNAILLLSKKGLIKQIDSQRKWGKSFNYSISGMPNKIYYKKSGNSFESNFLITDKENSYVTNLSSTKNGIFSNQNLEKFVNDFSEISWSPKTKLITAFSQNERLIEIRSAERKSKNNSPQNFIYTTNPIQQVIIDSSDNIYTLQKDLDKLYLRKMEFEKDQYKIKSSVFIEANVIDQMINSINEIFYWQNLNGYLSFKNFKNGKKRELFNIKFAENEKPKVTIIDRLRKNNKESVLTIFHQKNSDQIILFDGKNTKQIKTKYSLFGNSTVDENNFWYSQDKRKNYILYFRKNNKVQKFKMDFTTRTIKHLADFSTENIIDYFIENFGGKLYLVYSSKENFIKFQRI
ncbi:MAG: hypothetical protein IPH62_03140 [Ignavibacteriae bacterium]|nr:hypothetical protein [Ignavibacteriota bacterium]